MGSRVLLSQDLSASKFSMIIFETIHRGAQAAHRAALARVAAAAAAAPSSARRPRGPRWEAPPPPAGSREPRSSSPAEQLGRGRRAPACSPGASRRRSPARAEAATVSPGPSSPSPGSPGLDLPEGPAARARAPTPGASSSRLRDGPGLLAGNAAEPSGGRRAEKTEGASVGTVRGVFPASSTPKKMAAGKPRENLFNSRGESRSMLGRDASSARRPAGADAGVWVRTLPV